MASQMAAAQASISEKRIYQGYALQANDTIPCKIYFPEKLPYPDKLPAVAIILEDSIRKVLPGRQSVVGFGFSDNNKQTHYGIQLDTTLLGDIHGMFIQKYVAGRISLYQEKATDLLQSAALTSNNYNSYDPGKFAANFSPGTNSMGLSLPKGENIARSTPMNNVYSTTKLQNNKTIRSTKVMYFIQKQDSTVEHEKRVRLPALHKQYLAPYISDNPELLAMVPDQFSAKELVRFVQDYNYWWQKQKR
jgi:hypothetical protein